MCLLKSFMTQPALAEVLFDIKILSPVLQSSSNWVLLWTRPCVQGRHPVQVYQYPELPTVVQQSSLDLPHQCHPCCLTTQRPHQRLVARQHSPEIKSISHSLFLYQCLFAEYTWSNRKDLINIMTLRAESYLDWSQQEFPRLQYHSDSTHVGLLYSYKTLRRLYLPHGITSITPTSWHLKSARISSQFIHWLWPTPKVNQFSQDQDLTSCKNNFPRKVVHRFIKLSHKDKNYFTSNCARRRVYVRAANLWKLKFLMIAWALYKLAI